MRGRRTIPLTALALILGLWAFRGDRPAAAASYGGAASTRCCPADVSCAGHVEYRLQRQVVLRPVQETIFEPRQVTEVSHVQETVMRPRAVTTSRTVTETHYREEPYTVQKPVY